MIVPRREFSFFQKSFLDKNSFRFFLGHNCFWRRTDSPARNASRSDAGGAKRSGPINDRRPSAFFESPKNFFRQNDFVANLEQDIGSDGEVQRSVGQLRPPPCPQYPPKLFPHWTNAVLPPRTLPLPKRFFWISMA